MQMEVNSHYLKDKRGAKTGAKGGTKKLSFSISVQDAVSYIKDKWPFLSK